MNPSLLLIPDRYKKDKLYSQIPDSGVGDLTFARNSNATRVNSAGLIEKVRTNTLTHSQEFTNAGSWDQNVTNVTITAGQTDPNGGALGFLVTSLTTSNTYFYQTNAGTKTFSIFAKAGTRNNFSIINGVYNNGGAFNLATQTATSAGQGSLAKIESVGGGWFRCSVFMSSSSLMIVSNSNLAGTDNVIGDSLTYAFAQAETGDIATDYIPTTTAAVSVGITADIPRLDYTGGGCPSLLLEPQRTNLALFSEQFNNAYWTKDKVTVTANNAVAPDGTTSADLVFPNANGTADFEVAITRFTSGLSTEARTVSIYIKPSGWQYVYLLDAGGAGRVWFDLQNGTVGTQQGSTIGAITTMANGWYRLSVIRNNPQGSFYYYLGFSNADNSTVCTASGTNGVHLWGAQLEAGSYVLSYIPTLGSSVTRLADAASKTGISSLIGQTAGTLYVEAEYTRESVGAIARKIISLNDGSSANLIDIFVPAGDNTLNARIRANSTTLGEITISNTPTGKIKIAYAYKENDYALYINGTQFGTVTSGGAIAFSAAVSIAQVGDGEAATDELGGRVSAVALYPTRISNSELQSLTSL
jgi:hypothetical protein